jgi:hypothetical protein
MAPSGTTVLQGHASDQLAGGIGVVASELEPSLCLVGLEGKQLLKLSGCLAVVTVSETASRQGTPRFLIRWLQAHRALERCNGLLV